MSDHPAGPGLQPTDRSPLRALVHNLGAGVQLASGRPLVRDAFHVSLTQILALLLLHWLLVAVAERIAVASDASFWIWGFMGESAHMYLWLATLALIAWTCRCGQELSTLLVILGYASLPVWALVRALEQVAGTLVPDIDTPYTTVFYGCALLWSGVLCWRALGLLPVPAGWRRWPACVAYVVSLYGIAHELPESPLFYQAQEDQPQLDVEGIYYNQSELLDQAVAQLTPQIPHQTEFYFIGMGAYAEQDVFMREALQVRAIVDRQLLLSGHSLVLINNASTVATIPLANRHNLARATAAIGELMDRNDDIAVVFLTSHGYEDGAVSAEFGALGLNDIYAADIRDSLDAAGIRWRVVIVSACYSGGFIDELKSPDTIVITAAARDRASFGCSHTADWTYFGQAYFADALAQTTDFVEAFHLASAAIAARERRELKTPSNPQIWVGSALARHLHEGPVAPATRTQPSDSR